jgi:VCBS repeat-containing protein
MAKATTSTPAKTTAKVATLTGAAKDDLLAGGNEDSTYADLNVLANDPGAARLWSLVQSVPGMAPGSQVPTSLNGVFTLASGATISANLDGTIHYDGSGLSLQSLAQGQSFTDTFVYTVRMANGALSTATASVVVAGVNDAPTLVAPAIETVTDTADAEVAVTVVGTLNGADVDNGAVLTYSLVGGSSAYGAMTVNPDGTWSFTDVPGAVDALGDGQEGQAIFQAIVTDEHGAFSNPVDIVIKFVGANDIAEVTGVSAGAVAEDGVLFATGDLDVADRDAGESLFALVGSLVATYGDFTFNQETGTWTYTLRNGADNVQALTAGQDVQDTLEVKSLDGTGTATITVTINGRDEPIVVPPDEPQGRTFIANHGKFESGHYVIDDFTAGDTLKYAGGLKPIGKPAWAIADFGDDLVLDTVISFVQNGNDELVDVVLVGYTDFTAAQLV